MYYTLNDAGESVAFGAVFTDEWLMSWEDLRERKHPYKKEVVPGVWVSTLFTGVCEIGGTKPHTWELCVFGGQLSGTVVSSVDAELEDCFNTLVKTVEDAEGVTKINNLREKRRNSSWAF